MWLGGWKDREDKPFGLNWVNVHKILGIFMGSGVTAAMNWDPIYQKIVKVLTNYRSRNTSMFGRATLVNTLACSKLFYVAAHMPLPRINCQRFTRFIFSFIWGGQHESIARVTLYNKPQDGGVGVVCPRVKCDSLMIRHIFQLLNYQSEDYLPKWTHFAVYWIGLYLRDIRPDFASNMIPHCLQFRPEFYTKALDLFKSYKRCFPAAGQFESVKTIYSNLVTKVTMEPLIERERNYPNIDFKAVWKATSDPFLDPELKTLNYRVAHRVLPVNARLWAYNVGTTMNCYFCGGVNAETLEHLFIDCRQAIVVWFFVKSLLWKMCNHRLKIDQQTVLFCQYPRSVWGIDKDLVHYVVSLTKQAIWLTRNRVKFEYYRFDGASSLSRFKKLLKQRISVDFIRYSQMEFIERWGRGDLVCTIIEDTGQLQFNF